jgi:hypothetical protein
MMQGCDRRRRRATDVSRFAWAQAFRRDRCAHARFFDHAGPSTAAPSRTLLAWPRSTVGRRRRSASGRRLAVAPAPSRRITPTTRAFGRRSFVTDARALAILKWMTKLLIASPNAVRIAGPSFLDLIGLDPINQSPDVAAVDSPRLSKLAWPARCTVPVPVPTRGGRERSRFLSFVARGQFSHLSI